MRSVTAKIADDVYDDFRRKCGEQGLIARKVIERLLGRWAKGEITLPEREPERTDAGAD